ncbi:EAL domain-containing protein [Qipengyuania marisflavi]|uniref:EAL domain-containing protein n=1 Tax=Qipengyuania marisflavi TaxID=2486356 RepID=A0A5S3PUY1_9SPHN|nr:EAL domain-containing protein [Qipengyuania marisflavi]TMM47377.1 EAL domain-containing protein [Qipengyuania marisflavi]
MVDVLALGKPLRSALSDGIVRMGRRLERLQHMLLAAVISLAMMAVLMLSPVDQFLWLVQSKVAAHDPSGDIVFVGTDRAMGDPETAHRRSELAETLHELNRRGVGKIYLDLTFESASDTKNDAALRNAITSLGPRIAVVDRLEYDVAAKARLHRTLDSIAGTSGRVLSVRNPNYLGFEWQVDHRKRVNGIDYRTFGAALGGVNPASRSRYEIDYGIDVTKIPSTEFRALTSNNSKSGNIDLAGKTVVIGRGRQLADALVAIPGQHSVPSSYVAIYAAETYKAGRTRILGSLVILLYILFGLVTTILFAGSRKHRRVAYALLVISLPLGLFMAAKVGVRVEIANACAMLLMYAVFRSRARWQQRVALIDQDTGLPTLRALGISMAREAHKGGHVVIAKVHGYEHVLQTLKVEDKASYVLRLTDRLRAADKELTIYLDGHFLGWHVDGDDTDALVDHLEGLRAIFAAPVTVRGHTVDVGITFGIARVDGAGDNLIPTAIAAAEETTEASLPIKVAETGSELDLLWDISLRARIDEAMEAGEVYCVYQPKVDITENRMIGVEALVRWHDPAKGFIAPMHFIQQCENAGRMEHLTRYVLQSACTAAKLLHFRGQPITMSVNISATLLNDMRIVGLVRNVLQATQFDPKHLMLEVTETARITDLKTAASILLELKELGTRISMDDFGVGAANFETFYELPFDEIKIDRLFISNAATSRKAHAIAASIVAMGNEARISVVAEGVEDPRDLGMLRDMGCSEVQGYALSRPISLAKLLEFNANASDDKLTGIV